MRRAATTLLWTQAAWGVLIVLYAIFGAGRPEANNHPLERPQVGEGWY